MKIGNASPKNEIDLCGNWNFFWAEHAESRAYQNIGEIISDKKETFPCRVPGNIELDLFKIGRADDPFFGMNPVKVRKQTEWLDVYYFKKFNAEAITGNPVLVFEGLDCFADVYLNGEKIGTFDNMLIEHRIELKGRLIEGENEILVHIRPAVAEAQNYEYPVLTSTHPTGMEHLYVRKAPHMYGWDIMPRFVSAGIWRPVYITFEPTDRIIGYDLETLGIAEDRSSAQLELSYRIGADCRHGYRISLNGRCGGSKIHGEWDALFCAGKAAFCVDAPKLWWPRGSGKADLYDMELILYRDGTEIDRKEFRFGIRTVRLNRTSTITARGEGAFEFIINGRRIFVKGTNWVPVDAFHSRDRERIPAILEMAADLDCNMIRCWGGNVYEDDVFYELCDEKGIMVWQDFAMACARYPQDDEFCEKIRKEAVCVVKRLRNHACLVLWSGDNECDDAYLSRSLDPNKNRLTRQILPDVLFQHDPSRPYIASSPFTDEEAYGAGGNSQPERHLWGARDYFKNPFYAQSDCRFVSEIGYHGCPSPLSVKKFISADKLWPWQNNDEWLLHSTSPVPEAHAFDYRPRLMAKQIRELFREDASGLADFAFKSQSVQAEALKFFIELFRGQKGEKSGIIWWNLMDGWPQFSDAVVDYYFEKKLAYYFIKNSQQRVLVMLKEPENWKQKAVLVNDTPEDVTISFSITDISSGTVVAKGKAKSGADSAAEIAEFDFDRSRQKFYVIQWSGDASGKNHYLSGHPPFDFSQYKAWLEKSGMFGEYLDKTKAW